VERNLEFDGAGVVSQVTDVLRHAKLSQATLAMRPAAIALAAAISMPP
jgi:hypothetical protein